MDDIKLLAIDIGASSVKAAITNSRLEVQREAGFETGPAITNEVFLERLSGICEELKAKEVRAVGIGSPSPIDNRRGIIKKAVNLPKLVDLNLGNFFETKYALPCRLENDANAAALGIYRFHNDAGSIHDLFVFTLGTGIGGGAIIDGKLLTGEAGNSVEIGHITIDNADDAPVCGCGRRGCLEAYAAFSGIYNRLQEATGDENIPYSLSAILAEPKYEEAMQPILYKAGEALGQGVETVQLLFAPQKIIMVGGLANAWSSIEAGFNGYLAKHDQQIIPFDKNNLKILPEAPSGIQGAAALAMSLAHERRRLDR